MIEAALTFIGGSAFRMLWGEVAAFFTRRQEHAQELSLARLQAELEASRHERDIARLKLQSDLGIREVQVAGDVETSKIETDAWMEAVREVGRPSGVAWVDAWNRAIRPGLATLAAVAVVYGVYETQSLDEWTRTLVAAILGVYVADRTLSKRGK